MPTIKVRQIFSDCALARLKCNEPVAAHDAETGVDLHFRFEHAVGGQLRLSGAGLGSQTLGIGCDENDLNMVATLMLDGIKAHQATSRPTFSTV